MNVTTIVLINGLWMTALSWEHWARHYTDKGYSVIAANWPGMDGDIEQLRRDPSSFASLGLTDVVDHYEQIIRELETPPIIIGYGFRRFGDTDSSRPRLGRRRRGDRQCSRKGELLGCRCRC